MYPNIPVKTKTQAMQFVISACKRQYGFAPNVKDVDINQYNTKHIIFTTGGRKYIIKMYKEIPIVTLINFIPPNEI